MAGSELLFVRVAALLTCKDARIDKNIVLLFQIFY